MVRELPPGTENDPITLAVTRADGTMDVMYRAQPHQLPYHLSTVPNLLMVGPRGTGKSFTMRMDAHMRALTVPGFRYLIIRRTLGELKKSHLIDIGDEMTRLGGTYHITDNQAKYPNGSIGFYGYCDTPQDVMKSLSAQYDMVVFDEITTFPPELITKIAACCRVPKGAGRLALIRGGTNPLGVGADYTRRYYIDKDVAPEENADYNPDDYAVIQHRFTDNKHLDTEQYKKTLQNLPEHVRRAWLDGEWVVEGAYFTDFRPKKDGEPWHVIPEIPVVTARNGLKQSLIDQPWLAVYRAIDWGYSPDPAVCLWIAVLQNGRRAIVFREKTWRETLAADVAADIKKLSEGLHIVETFCDPTMLVNDGKGEYSIGEIFESNGVPLTPSTNKRDLYGYAIHNYLNTLVGDGQSVFPQIQIVAPSGYNGCPQLIKTIPLLRIDPKDPNKIADGDDHWAVALAYFCMAGACAASQAAKKPLRRWMLPKSQLSRHLYAT